jgi:MoaA/NifB/PqqE/SkfB family radical SAM enzyme
MRILSIHLTDVCNESCIFCVVGVPEIKSDTIVPERVRCKLVENAGKGYEAVNLHGGEPTVYKAFLNTLELIKDLGYPEVHIQTNGRTLKSMNFVTKIRGLNVELFIISMHGLKAETHESITRTKGGFAETLQGIRNVKATGGKVRTNTVIAKQNITELPNIIDAMLDMGVDHINISNLHPVYTAYLHFEQVTPTVEETRRWVPRAVDRALARNAVVTLEGFPLCTVPGYEALHVENIRKDHISMEFRGLWIKDYDQFMDNVCRTKGTPCFSCDYDRICGGVYNEYIEKRGWSEFAPVVDRPLVVLQNAIVQRG